MDPKIVTHSDWQNAQVAFLEKEKAFTHQRDALAKQRQELPWTLVEKPYEFEGSNGKLSFADLFNGKSQLFLQHFMFGPDWKEGCDGCSFQADHVNAALPHLKQRDMHFVAVSRAPIAKIEAYKKRMNWQFDWVSSAESDFNFDFQVSFTEKDKEANKVFYNFREDTYQGEELPGNSVFYKDNAGKIFRTFSSYGRGCEMLITTYMVLDLLPKGRDEGGYKVHPMEWIRRHDEYESEKKTKSCH